MAFTDVKRRKDWRNGTFFKGKKKICQGLLKKTMKDAVMVKTLMTL